MPTDLCPTCARLTSVGHTPDGSLHWYACEAADPSWPACGGVKLEPCSVPTEGDAATVQCPDYKPLEGA